MDDIIQKHADIISHIHISEPMLAQVMAEEINSEHVNMSAVLKKNRDRLRIKIASIEMKRASEGLAGLSKTISRVKSIYAD